MDLLAMAHVEQALVPPLHGAYRWLGIPGQAGNLWYSFELWDYRV